MNQSVASGGSDGTPWHRWADSNEVVGIYAGRDQFERQDGTTADFAILDTENGKVRVGLDYAVLRSEWSKKDPQVGDTVLIMRAEQKAESKSGREYWPFAVAVQKGQQKLAGVGIEDQVTKPQSSMDPDDDIPF